MPKPPFHNLLRKSSFPPVHIKLNLFIIFDQLCSTPYKFGALFLHFQTIPSWYSYRSPYYIHIQCLSSDYVSKYALTVVERGKNSFRWHRFITDIFIVSSEYHFESLISGIKELTVIWNHGIKPFQGLWGSVYLCRWRIVKKTCQMV